MQNQDLKWMTQALKLAQHAASQGEVPVGAVIVHNNTVVAEGYNHPIMSSDPTCHAEIDGLRQGALRRQNYRFAANTTLYVTIEPCTMCVGAIIHARIGHVVFGAREPRAGAVVSQLQLLDQGHYNHKVAWREGVLADECSQIMVDFFRSRRKSL